MQTNNYKFNNRRPNQHHFFSLAFLVPLRDIIFFIFLFLSCTGNSYSQETNYNVACIGFYNLENLFDTINQPDVNDEEFTPDGANLYTGKIYLDKLSKLSKVISMIGKEASPDGLALMGCAEVENQSVLNDLVHEPLLKDRHYRIVHFDSKDERGIDVGLIYNPKYFTVRFAEPLFVEIFNADGSPHFTRDVLYVAGDFNGEPLHILVNHWPSRRGGEEASAPSRAKAAAVCKAKIDSIEQTELNAKIIVMGDLNDDPVSPSVAKILGAKGDEKKVERGGLYNPWVRYYKKGIGTLAYNDAWNLFDQIIITDGWLNKEQTGYFFKEATIFKRSFMMQKTGRYKEYPLRTFDFNKYVGGYSDHFPTYVVLLKKN